MPIGDEQPSVPKDVDELFPSNLSDVDHLFPPEVERNRKPKDIPSSSPIHDMIFGNNDDPTARVLDAFGQGVKHAWGSEPLGFSPESVDALKKAGLFNDYQKGHVSIIKAANEALMRPAAVALDAGMRALMGVGLSGPQAAVAQIGTELGQPRLGREIAALPEAFFGTPHPMGVPKLPVDLPKARSLGIIGEGEAGWKGTAEPVSRETAWDAYVDSIKNEKPEASAPVAGQPSVAVPELGTPSTPDINAVARGFSPDLFYKYDELTRRREVFAEQARDPDIPAAVAQHAEVKLRETETELRAMAPEISDAYRKANEVVPGEDAPIAPAEPAPVAEPVAGARPIEEQRAFIANDVSEKLQAAGRPKAEADAAAEIEAAYWTTRAERFKGAKGTAEEMYRAEAPEILGPGMQSDFRTKRAKSKARVSLGQFVSSIGIKDSDPLVGDVRSITGGRRYIRKDGISLDEMRERAAEAGYIEEGGTINGLLDAMREEDKGRKVFKRGEEAGESFDRESHLNAMERALDDGLREVGLDPAKVPEEVHSRALELMDKGERDPITAYEKAEAEEGLFQKGERNLFTEREAEGQTNLPGTEQLTDAQMAQRRADAALKAKAPQKPADFGLFGSEKDQKELFQGGDIIRGRITLRENGRNTITMLKDSNASTFIHEKGHDYLHRMMRDARDERAPAELRADADVVMKWLGVEKPSEIKTSHHERFARGFENYIMEGRAPTRALARVFEQFRQWLVRIYQTAERLKSPINDDIRAVFDRMLTVKPEEVVIAPELKRPDTLSDYHAAVAERTPPEAAHDAAELMRAERDSAAAKHFAEEQDARLANIEAEASRRTAGVEEPNRDGNAAGPVPGEAGTGAPSGPVSAGGSPAAAEGVGPSGGAGAGAKLEPPSTPHSPLPPPETTLLDKAGNIRLDNLNTPEEINVLLREMAARNDDFMAARRGVISDAQVLDLADAMGMDASQISKRKLGEAFNAEQVMAARKLLIQSATEVRDAMAKAAMGDEAAVMAYGQAKARFQMIEEHMNGITAEAGRALRAFRSLDGLKEAKELGALLEQSTGMTLYQLRREAQLGMSLDTPQKVAKFVHDSKRATFKDMILEFWINALLSGPITHVKNVIGNTLIAVNNVAETGIAGVIGKARETLTGEKPAIELGEAKAKLYGLFQGAQEGIVAAKDAFKNEESYTRAQTMEQRKFQAIPGQAGKVIRIPGRFLTAEDEFFKAVAVRQELNAMGYREAIAAGLKGDAFNAKVADVVVNPTDAQLTAAKKASEYQTFTNALGPTGRAIQNFSNSHFLAKVVIPFIRTPINLLKYAAERTPIGLMSVEIRDNLAGKNGAASRDMQAARLAMGTMVMAAVTNMVAQGVITGGGPSDPHEKATLMLTGWRPYSIKIGETYYAYDWLDPFATIMGITADLAEAYRTSTTDDDAELSKVAAATLGSISKNILSKASLRGASDLVQTITDPDRYGPRYFQNLAGSVVPSVVGQAARISDPVQREVRTTLDGIKNRIPGLKATLLPKRDIWGEPIVSEGAAGPDVVSPVRISSVNNDPVNQRLVAVGLWPSKLQRKIRGVELTDEQFDDYSRTAGRMAKLRLNAMVAQPGFSTLPQGVQREMMNKTINSAREAARSLIMMQNPEIIQEAMEAKTEKLR